MSNFKKTAELFIAERFDDTTVDLITPMKDSLLEDTPNNIVERTSSLSEDQCIALDEFLSKLQEG